jgi:ATP-dependent Clp protease ATP-binding subunit ClpA
LQAARGGRRVVLFIRRRIAQLAAQLAEAATPLEALRLSQDLRRELEAFERHQVARALAQGTTFTVIARQLGVTRQAAHRRYRSLTENGAPLTVTPAVRRLLNDARGHATALGAETAAGEHLLFASLRAPDLRATGVLHRAGATGDRAHQLLDRAARGEREAAAGELAAVLAAAAREARARAGREIDVEHLLIGCLADGDASGSRLLRALGVDEESVRSQLAALLDSDQQK